MKIVGISHPIPTEFAKRIYKGDKTVFVGKSYLGKVSEGDKFIIYESHGARAYTGWADIKFIGKLKTSSISRRYGKKLLLNSDEFREYSKNRKEMVVIEFDNFELFKKPVKPKGYYVTVAGKYIDENEFKMIDNNRG
ncbi:MAG: DUF365 domain-containing protein [Methanobacterium sp.]|nr:MAG: DUF365 domain-containing protein [Methanobacterium sp.]